MYTLGFDPGYSNLGMGVYQHSTGIAKLYIIDLTHFDGQKHDLHGDDFGPLIFEALQKYAHYIKHADFIGIERLPSIGCRRVLQVQCHLESVMRHMSNGVVLLVCPRSYHAWWKTSAKTYASRKRKSANSTLLNKTDAARATKVFTRGKTFKVDGIEATQLAMYVYAHRDKLRYPEIRNTPRDFLVLEMSAHVGH